MRLQLALLIGKTIAYLSRRFNIGGGSAAPGLYALKVEPDLVAKLVKNIPKNVIITGTNGKTTTARMIAHFAQNQGLKVIRNHTGSNLERGIASTLITHARPGLAKLDYDLGIWELDEAAFNTVAPKIKPDIVVFLNVFRDQLDRYGEVDTVVKGWSNTLKSFASRSELKPQTVILVNGDDENCAKLKSAFKGKLYQFGVKDYKIVGEAISHKKEQENLDFEATDVKLKGLSGTIFSLIISKACDFVLNHESLIINLPLPGVYHIYDFLAAFSVSHELGFSTKSMISSLKGFSPAFGRVERIDFGYIFLIKNPAGATQVFETIAPNLKKDDRLLLALNDNLADGTDVSWIWDANFEQLSLRVQRGNLVYVSGTRAYDLANRLKYAGFNHKNMAVQTNLKKVLQEARIGLKGRLFILPTYTAMLELQSILTKMGIKKNYWEEES